MYPWFSFPTERTYHIICLFPRRPIQHLNDFLQGLVKGKGHLERGFQEAIFQLSAICSPVSISIAAYLSAISRLCARISSTLT